MKETFFNSLKSIGISINNLAMYYGVYATENITRSVRHNLLRQGIKCEIVVHLACPIIFASAHSLMFIIKCCLRH